MRTSIALLFFGLCAFALAGPTRVDKYGLQYRVADNAFLQKQRDVLRLLKNIFQSNTCDDQLQLANTYRIEDHLNSYSNQKAVKEFMYYYKGGFMGRGQVFSIYNQSQRQQAVALFQMLYYARDWQTFYATACWARQNVNEGMFVYAIHAAVLHRLDTQGMVLPPIYEIYPYFFVNSQVIQQAYELKMKLQGNAQGIRGVQNSQARLGVQNQGVQDRLGYLERQGVRDNLGVQKRQSFGDDLGLQNGQHIQGNLGVQGRQGYQSNLEVQDRQGSQDYRSRQVYQGVQSSQNGQDCQGEQGCLNTQYGENGQGWQNMQDSQDFEYQQGGLNTEDVLNSQNARRHYHSGHGKSGHSSRHIRSIWNTQESQDAQDYQDILNIYLGQSYRNLQDEQGSSDYQRRNGAQGGQRGYGPYGSHGTQGGYGQDSTSHQGSYGPYGSHGTQGGYGQDSTSHQGNYGSHGTQGGYGQDSNNRQGSYGPYGSHGTQGGYGQDSVNRQTGYGSSGIQGSYGQDTLNRQNGYGMYGNQRTYEVQSSEQQNRYVIIANYSQRMNSEQGDLSYFTEDIGLNAYYYYYNLDYPFWLGGAEFGLTNDRRGELYYYVHQQILARYYLERLSNGYGSIDVFDWKEPIRTGYMPSMRNPNGMELPTRPAYVNLMTNSQNQCPSQLGRNNQFTLQQIEDYERRIRDAIDLGYIYTEDGTKINLYTEEGLDLLGRVIESSPDSPNTRYYGYLHIIAQQVLGYSSQCRRSTNLNPSALEHFETALRDPVFYQFYKRITYYFLRYKNNLPEYTYSQLNYPGVTIENVQVDKLVTYFENFEWELTNALPRNEESFNPQIWVRQQRLNHRPYNYKIDVQCNRVQDVVVRVFLGPKYNEHGEELSLNENRMNFVELEKYVYTLQPGKNVIERSSQQGNTVSDRTSYRALYQHVMAALQGQEEFRLDMTEAHNGFPSRLTLPKGTESGQVYQMYFYIGPYKSSLQKPTYDRIISAGVGSGNRYLDDLPMGYPLDRQIKYERNFLVPNSYMQDVVIYHTSNQN